MKKTISIIIALLFMAGTVYAAGLQVNHKAGEYNVEINLDKNPPTVGNNNMSIEIKDASGKYVTDAAVKVDYSMPAMPGMPAMTYHANAVSSGSKYTAKLDLSMPGSWNIAVKISKAGRTSTVKFNVDAQ